MSAPFNCWATSTRCRSSGTVEIHDGPFGLLGGAIHLPVGTDITTRNVFFNGGKAGLIADAGTATLLYRVLEQPDPVRRFRCRLPRLGIFGKPDLEPRDPSGSRASIVRPAGSIR